MISGGAFAGGGVEKIPFMRLQPLALVSLFLLPEIALCVPKSSAGEQYRGQGGGGMMPQDARLYASAAQRNRGPILDVLRRYLPERGLVLEIASGSGEHVVHFAAHLPDLVFQPSDPDPAARASIDAWRAAANLPNVRPALALDVTEKPWPVAAAEAVICINMVHIAPWRAAEALVAGAARILAPEGILYLYGPYKFGGRHTAPSNASFDESLRARNPEWGVRDAEAVTRLAVSAGFEALAADAMPANNFSLVFRRAI